MMNLVKTTAAVRRLMLVIGLIAVSATLGCHTKTPQKQNKEFFTSGSREADQRASQRMAKEEQLTGSGEGAGEKNVKKAAKSEGSESGSTNKAAQAEGKLALFDRLGGEKGITAIVEDATPRILQDPRVNFSRSGVKSTGFSLKRERTVTWQATPENVAQFKKHLVQFIALASGGPAHYEGKDMKSVHADMKISNPEFDAAVGDVKASLDKLQIPNTEQKELLAIIESTRPEIVTVR
ncbi:MAG: globin-like protein [Pedosphaera sp.]|nr:globin-like protein [Pedosphaera sp.]